MKSVFVLVLGFILLNATAKADQENQTPVEITKVSELKDTYNSTVSIGDLKQIEVINRNGDLVTYTISPQIDNMSLSGWNLSLGQRTKCDPYLGELSQSIVIHTSVQKIQKDWGDKSVPLVKPLAIVVRIPARFRVQGLCGENANELLGAGVYSNGLDPRSIKIWAEGEDEPADDTELAQKIAQYESTRLQVKELSTQFKEAIDTKDFQAARKVSAKFHKLAMVTLDSESSAFSKILNTIPDAEKPVDINLYNRSSISIANFQATFGVDLDEITLDELKTIATNFAKNPVIPEVSDSEIKNKSTPGINAAINLEGALNASLPNTPEGNLFYKSFLIQELHSLLKILESATKETSKNSILAVQEILRVMPHFISGTNTEENGKFIFRYNKAEVQTYLDLLNAIKQFKTTNPLIFAEIEERADGLLFYLKINTTYEKETRVLFESFKFD